MKFEFKCLQNKENRKERKEEKEKRKKPITLVGPPPPAQTTFSHSRTSLGGRLVG
jgi:hypothetical protein